MFSPGVSRLGTSLPLGRPSPWTPSAPVGAETWVQVKPIQRVLYGHKHSVSRGDSSSCHIYPFNLVFLSSYIFVFRLMESTLLGWLELGCSWSKQEKYFQTHREEKGCTSSDEKRIANTQCAPIFFPFLKYLSLPRKVLLNEWLFHCLP